MTLAIDTMLENRYRIDRLIGQGGMGAIYQGYDTNLDVDVAIKENFLQTPQSIHQFQQEARILAKLHHAALPRVMYHFSMAGQQYLVMDYIEGEDLWQMINRLKRPLDEAQAVRYILQICDAVQYLHEQQPPIIHRDIKPQNIKVTPKGQAVLVDFGIAKVAEQGALTSTGARGVTPGFSPPEQYSGEGTTPRSDIYALGATLYALLTAEKPPDSISLLTGKAKFDALGQSKFNLSEPLLQAIRHAMQPLESNRPASVADWQAELTGQIAPPPMPVEPRQTTMAEVKTLVPTEILPEPTVIETQGTFSQSPTVVETQATDLRFPTEVSSTPPKSSSNMGMWLLGIWAVAVCAICFCFLMLMMSGGGGAAPTPMPEKNISVPIPTPQFVQKLSVPSNTNSGITFQASKSGVYIFKYSDSAYSVGIGYGWLTKVYGFSGSAVLWSKNNDLIDGAALFIIDSKEWAYKLRQEAIKATKDIKANVWLNKGDWVTLVVQDGKLDYEDNTGEVVLDVFFIP